MKLTTTQQEKVWEHIENWETTKRVIGSFLLTTLLTTVTVGLSSTLAIGIVNQDIIPIVFGSMFILIGFVISWMLIYTSLKD